MIITDGSGDGGQYGCALHRAKAACANAVRVRRDYLEKQLLDLLTHDLLRKERIEQAMSSFYAKLEKRMLEVQTETISTTLKIPELQKELTRTKSEVRNLTDVIAENGVNGSTAILVRLAETEAQVKKIEEQLVQGDKTGSFSATFEEISSQAREFVQTKLQNIQSVLTSAPSVGQQVLRNHIKKIILTPQQCEKSTLDVAIEFRLGCGEAA